MKEYKVEMVRTTIGAVNPKIVEQKINEMAQAGWNLDKISQGSSLTIYLVFSR